MSSDPTAVSAIVEPITLIFTSLAKVHWGWWFSHLVSAVALPLRLLLIPLFFIGRLVLAVLSPILFILTYIFACISAVFAFIASLEPLYTFFGVAAVFGIVAGIILGACTNLINSNLGIMDDSYSEELKLTRRRYLEDDDEDGISSARDSTSSGETDWQWLDTSTSPTRRKQASGLQSQTIHEEDDSSEAAL